MRPVDAERYLSSEQSLTSAYMDHTRGDITPVSTEITTWRRSMSNRPPLVEGEQVKKMTLKMMRRASTMMNVGFLPTFLVMGTASATPTIFATSPTPRNRPEQKRMDREKTRMCCSPPMTSAKKNATVAPRTVLKRLKQRDAPLRSHQGLLVTRALRSLPSDAELTVVRVSRVSLKQRRKRMKQQAAMTIMANCQLDWRDMPNDSLKSEQRGSQAKSAMNEPPQAKNMRKDEKTVFSCESSVMTPSIAPQGTFMPVQTVIIIMYVTQAHTSLAAQPQSGVVNKRMPQIENGAATQRRQGRYLPQRVRVRSATIPIMGSLTASQIRVTRRRTPVSIRLMPKTLAQKNGRQQLNTFQNIDDAMSPKP